MEAVKQTVAQNLGLGGAHDMVPEDQRFDLNDTPDQKGKVAVITGGSEGIGYGALYTLLKFGLEKAFVISVDQVKIDEALKAISKDLGEETAKKVTWLQCDLADWKATKETADKISKRTDRIDILMNNAARGIMTHQLTDYGVDRHMAINHMSAVILTSHLLPILKKTASPTSTVRIVNQASNAHQFAPSDTKFASLDELNTDLGANGQYGRSKLANILYSRYLARHLTSTSHPHILVNATHPGFVDTKMSSEDIHEPFPIAGYVLGASMGLKKNIWQGCVSIVFAGTKTTKTGEYVCPPAVPESGSELSQNVELQEQLMKLTRGLVSEKTEPDSKAKGCPFSDY